MKILPLLVGIGLTITIMYIGLCLVEQIHTAKMPSEENCNKMVFDEGTMNSWCTCTPEYNYANVHSGNPIECHENKSAVIVVLSESHT